MYKNWVPELITPLLPPEGNTQLEDMALDLCTKSSEFSSRLHPRVKGSIADLIRSMNCYYSNLIEGHNTHPIDIERALNNDYSKDHKKRSLQLEAKAHIETQLLIDQGQLTTSPYQLETILRLHKEFLSRVPEEMLKVKNAQTGETKTIIPGSLRDGDVQVGAHIAPPTEKLRDFINFYQDSYTNNIQSKIRKLIAIPAAHHRLLWIHPFYDGNGRVVRLLDYLAFKDLQIGNSLWTASRGLARNQKTYKELLMLADEQRKDNLDGRGNLSLSALIEFCIFYLEICIDQVEFMNSVLELSGLLNRIEKYTLEKQQTGLLPKGSFQLLQHALLHGEFERGKAAQITGYKTRQARTVLAELLKQELLLSDSPKGKVRLAFGIEASASWFPKLFPEV